MNENEKKSSTLTIVGLVALILVLFVAIKVIFAGLDAMLPDEKASPYTVLNTEKGEEGDYWARLLTEDEVQAKDVQDWLEQAEDWATDREGSAFWLCRMDSGEYLLYLPDQERALTEADFTASEERDEDGEITLVLRARTPEKSKEVVPEEQLFCLATESDQWKGIRLKIILDGRELNVYKLASKGGKLYSTEEMYIGREL